MNSRQFTTLVLSIALLAASGCMQLSQVVPAERPKVYQAQGSAQALVERFAPVFLVQNYHQTYNRIGSPVASRDEQGEEVITMDTTRPAMYWRVVKFKTARGDYTNLLYRVHFPSTPASLIPFFIGAGSNMGDMVVITLNAQNQPVLITTLGTCGCYTASVPTNFTPKDSYPEGWIGKPLEVYGETLPALLKFGKVKDPRLMVVLGPGEHRIAGLKVLPSAKVSARSFDLIPTELLPAEDLKRLPLGKGHTSLFYEDGALKGHVKGAWKPLETILLGWLCLDWVVGMDKVYGDPDNPMYTSLKPWNRYRSNLADFPQFLKYWDWGL